MCSTIGVDISSSDHDSSEDGSDDESTQVNQSFYDFLLVNNSLK